MKTKKELEEKKQSKFGIVEVILLVFLTCILSLGFGYYLGSDQKTTPEEDKYVEKFMKNYRYLIDNYYKDVDKEALIDAAIRGMVESLGDEYSEFMTESESNTFDISLEGEYEGIGITITNDHDGNIVVIDVTENSPAAKAGIQVGDIIKKADDQNVENTATNVLTEYIQNHKEVKLILNRDNKDIEVSVTKEKIVLKSVDSKMIERNGKKIGYIYISIFALNTAEQFEEAIQTLEKQGMQSLIIDVRDNGGGHLVTAKQMISLLLDKSKVMYQIELKGERTKEYSTGKETKTYPIVLLTNENSASGSEMLTASLKENVSAISIGTKTYGKGTVQELKSLPSGSEYKITTKKWLTPNGNDINGKGIKPDIEIQISETFLQTRKEEDDNQLQAAIQYLEQK